MHPDSDARESRRRRRMKKMSALLVSASSLGIGPMLESTGVLRRTLHLVACTVASLLAGCGGDASPRRAAAPEPLPVVDSREAAIQRIEEELKRLKEQVEAQAPEAAAALEQLEEMREQSKPREHWGEGLPPGLWCGNSLPGRPTRRK